MNWSWRFFGGFVDRFPVSLLIFVFWAIALRVFGQSIPDGPMVAIQIGSFFLLLIWMLISIARSGMQSPEPHWTIRLWSIFDRPRHPDEDRDPEQW
ncbi:MULTISPECIES: hypothetical protein [Hyphobacterium]|uniref:Uncharacterized protein n=1 Tax=Hyphobacterium vulgare TaxID=1736751 RepID=A0ABV6ZZA0_9PROT